LTGFRFGTLSMLEPRGNPQQRQQQRRDKLADALQARIAANQERLTQQAA